jgi:hypothetical protein
MGETMLSSSRDIMPRVPNDAFMEKCLRNTGPGAHTQRDADKGCNSSTGLTHDLVQGYGEFCHLVWLGQHGIKTILFEVGHDRVGGIAT